MTQAQRNMGRYLIAEEIASGGMAVVYRAKLVGVEGFEKEFAVKKILPHWSRNPEFIRMLVDEAKILVKLHHPNIVQVFELGRHDGAYFIAMEFVDGCDLKTLMRKLRRDKRPFPLKLVCHLARQLCAGLEFAHTQHDARGRETPIVHRDISPQNVLLGRDGQIKLTDFGIAKITGAGKTDTTGNLKGKFSYMSPEQAMGKGVDVRTDVFALGALLFETVTGKKCFDGDNDLAILEKVKRAEVSLPDTVNPDLRRILEKALAADKRNRYRSVAELRGDIEILENELPSRAGMSEFRAFLGEIYPGKNQGVGNRESATQWRPLHSIAGDSRPDGTLVIPEGEHDTLVMADTMLLEATEIATPEQPAAPREKIVPARAVATPRVTALPLRGRRLTQSLWLAALPLAFLTLAYRLRERPVATAPLPTTQAERSADVSSSTISVKPGMEIQSAPIPHDTPPPLVSFIIEAEPRDAVIEINAGDIRQTGTGLVKAFVEIGNDTVPVNVRVTRDGYATNTLARELTPSSGRDLREKIILEPSVRQGSLSVEARPWGLASVDGMKARETPGSFTLKAGEHVVRVDYPPGKQSVSRKIRVGADGKITCRASFGNVKKIWCSM